MAGDRGVFAPKGGRRKSGAPNVRAPEAGRREDGKHRDDKRKDGAHQDGAQNTDVQNPGAPNVRAPGSGVPHSRTPRGAAPPEHAGALPRVTVAHPRTLAARSSQPLPGSRALVADDLGRQTPLGDVYLRSLMRTQLRLAALVVGALAVVLGVLPVLLATVPSVRDSTLAGVPVPWLVIGVAVHPVILALAWVYQRQARKNEAEFADLVERS